VSPREGVHETPSFCHLSNTGEHLDGLCARYLEHSINVCCESASFWCAHLHLWDANVNVTRAEVTCEQIDCWPIVDSEQIIFAVTQVFLKTRIFCIFWYALDVTLVGTGSEQIDCLLVASLVVAGSPLRIAETRVSLLSRGRFVVVSITETRVTSLRFVA
jgi:hypothetical protein